MFALRGGWGPIWLALPSTRSFLDDLRQPQCSEVSLQTTYISMDSTTEIACILGAPARLGARVLFLPRYLFEGPAVLQQWSQNEYARARFGPSYRWRLWLLFDVKQAEMYEKLINGGSDDEILCMRESQLEQFRLVALVVSSTKVSIDTFALLSC